MEKIYKTLAAFTLHQYLAAAGRASRAEFFAGTRREFCKFFI